MDICMGTMPVPGLPSTIPVAKGVSLIVERGGRNDSITLRDDAQDVSVELADIVRDIVWCCNLDAGILVLGSEYGRHVYTVDTDDFQVIGDLTIFRDKNRMWNRLGILATPDGIRVVVISDWTMHLLSWGGDVLFEQRLESSYTVAALDDVSITLRDDGDGELRIYRFPV